MLLRFSVENALCFNAEATLSLIATNDERHLNHVAEHDGQQPPALRVAALYGANGHGKTNLVIAIAALKNLVVEQKWTLRRFKLEPTAKTRPTRLVIEFRHENMDYEYGVVMDGKIVAEEWLFQTDSERKENKLFERTTSKSNDEYLTILEPGRLLKRMASPAKNVKMDKYLEIISSGLKENRPLLSEASEREIPFLSPAYKWISEVLTPVTATANYEPLFERTGDDQEFRRFLEDFLKKCDVGINEIRAKKIKISAANSHLIPEDVIAELENLDEEKIVRLETREGISMTIDRDDDGDFIVRNIGAVRKDSSGKDIEFSFDEESSGTRRLLDLAPMLADPQDKRVYVVDELDRKLHPLLSYEFVCEFLKKTTGQLILTTHNTHLMDLDLLRRDEIWFVQKRPDGSADLYSLTEMKIRPDLNVRKGYINGRFGAIPLVGGDIDSVKI